MTKNKQDPKAFVFIAIYAFIVLLDLVCSSNDSFYALRYYTKPAILIALILFFIKQKKELSTSVFRLMLGALLFSLAGDILLLFVVKSQLFFITGLVMFLLAHIMYTFVFLKKRNKQNKNKRFLLLTILYGAGLFYLLYPRLEDMLVPVALYMLVILVMSNTAYLRQGKVSVQSYIMVFLGSLFFMLSDSILAFTMFYKPLVFDNIWIMTTYATAQILIVYGILKQKNNAFLQQVK